MTREPARPAQGWVPGSPAVRDTDVTWVTLGYLGAIFTGPLIPLAVYLLRRGSSAFARYHSSRALNLSVTALLYGVCCVILGGMLALDAIALALAVAIPLLLLLWLMMLKYLIRGVLAAHRGEAYQVPGWICATIVDRPDRPDRPDNRLRPGNRLR
jgi:uncharacterized Tic20 family protein